MLKIMDLNLLVNIPKHDTQNSKVCMILFSPNTMSICKEEKNECNTWD